MAISRDSDDYSHNHNNSSNSWGSGILARVFGSCQSDPKGSIHRAWGVSLLFIVFFFVISIVEMINLQSYRGSTALVVGSVWTGLSHVGLGILGTFVLRRFPTAFSVGFFLATLLVVANQDLILFGTFYGYQYGSPQTNHVFANVGMALFCVLVFFMLLLFHFKQRIIVAPVDIKGGASGGLFGKKSSAAARAAVTTDDYQAQEDA